MQLRKTQSLFRHLLRHAIQSSNKDGFTAYFGLDGEYQSELCALMASLRLNNDTSDTSLEQCIAWRAKLNDFYRALPP